MVCEASVYWAHPGLCNCWLGWYCYGFVVSHLCQCSGFSLSFCSLATFNLSDDILLITLMDDENLKLISVHYKHGSLGYINICVKQKNSSDWCSFQPHTAFSCVGSFVGMTHTKTFFFHFNYLAQSYGEPRESKQSFYQSVTSSGLMYLCAFKIESYGVIKPFLHSSARKTDLFWGSFPQLTDIL